LIFWGFKALSTLLNIFKNYIRFSWLTYIKYNDSLSLNRYKYIHTHTCTLTKKYSLFYCRNY